jgi:hypothetical protein
MMIGPKALIVMLFLIVTACLYFTARFGRLIQQRRRAGESERTAMILHLSFAITTLVLDLIAVWFTETLVRSNGGIQNPLLFGIHIPFSVTFQILLILLVARPLAKVLKRAKILERNHIPIAKWCVRFYAATLVTGFILITRV